MKIAITVQYGEDLKAPLDPRFGRCGVFLVVDHESGEVLELIPNVSRDASHGAGVSATAAVARAGVEAVISGRFGPKAMTGLQAKGIHMYSAPAEINAGEALERFRKGELAQEQMREFR
jgi:predicted Fe-Mo cluster-binding NifX family protein